MTEFITYGVKVILLSGIFTAYYLLALRNKNFHKWNRFYLSGSVVLSLLLPLIQIPVSVLSENSYADQFAYPIVMQDEIIVSLHQAVPNLLMGMIYGSYLCISGFLILRICYAIFRIVRIRRSHAYFVKANTRVYQTEEEAAPFSFLNTIYWNQDIDINSASGRAIFEHELTHIREKHTWDNLFLNLVISVFWANPFFWFIRKEMLMVQEFAADRASLRAGDTEQFAGMILSASRMENKFSLANHFIYSPIKRRFIMIQKHTQKQGLYSRVLAITMAFALFFAVSCTSKTEEDLPKLKSKTVAPPPTNAVIPTTPKSDKIFVKVEKEATFPGGNSAWIRYISKAISSELNAFTEADFGTSIIKFVVNEDGTVSDVEATTMQNTQLARTAVEAIRKGPRWVPAEQNGIKVAAYRMQPVTLKNPDMKSQ